MLALSAAAELTGLSVRQLTDLQRAGQLESRTVDGTPHVLASSLIDWATGFRPDLLDVLEANVGRADS